MALSTILKLVPWLLCDSQSGIALAKNPVYHETTKHIGVWYRFIWECVAIGCSRSLFLEKMLRCIDQYLSTWSVCALMSLQGDYLVLFGSTIFHVQWVTHPSGGTYRSSTIFLSYSSFWRLVGDCHIWCEKEWVVDIKKYIVIENGKNFCVFSSCVRSSFFFLFCIQDPRRQNISIGRTICLPLT